MPNPVTKRFVDCHDTLKTNQIIKSSRQFALAIDTHPQGLNEILKGNRDATVKNLMHIVEVYNVNPTYLLSGDGDMFQDQKQEQEQVCIKEDRITYIPTPAYAGLMDQMHETVYEEDMTTFSIPGYQDMYGEHRCFDVAGDSMEPTLTAGDKIVCSQVAVSSIKDKYVYVIVTQSDIMVKRVISLVHENNTITLLSDNEFYTPVQLHVQEIKEVWRVNLRLSQFMPHTGNANTGFLKQIESLEKTVQSQANCIQELQKSITQWMSKS